MPTDIYARLRDLAASAEAKPSEMRPVLLRVTTDLFALHPQHSTEEIHLYEEMAGKLIDSADEATLTHVARKLSLCADAPPSLVKRIRARGGEPEREIFRVDPQIEWRDLRHVAASGPCDLACAVAARADLDREVARLLSARPEREIARALAANPLAPLMRTACARWPRADATIPRSRAPCSTVARPRSISCRFISPPTRASARNSSPSRSKPASPPASGPRPATSWTTKPRRASKPPRFNRNARPSPCCSPTDYSATRCARGASSRTSAATRWRWPSSRSACRRPSRRAFS